MNKEMVAIQAVVSTGIGLAVNFLILRTVLRKLHRPQDEQQRTRVAAILAVLLSLPSLLRFRQLAALCEEQPAESRVG